MLALTPGSGVVGSADSSLHTVEKTHSRGWSMGGDPPLQVHLIHFGREGKGHTPVCTNTEKDRKISSILLHVLPTTLFLEAKALTDLELDM